jgi:hypothetical protein
VWAVHRTRGLGTSPVRQIIIIKDIASRFRPGFVIVCSCDGGPRARARGERPPNSIMACVWGGAQGVSRLTDSAFGDLWMPFLVFTLMLVTLIIGLCKLFGGPNIGTTLTISIIWMIYNLIPPYLLLHYTFIGRGTTLKFMCRQVVAVPSHNVARLYAVF